MTFTVIEPYGFVARLVRDCEFLSRATVERMVVSEWNSRFGRQRNGPLAWVDDIVNVHAVDRFTGGAGQYQRVVGREQEPGRRRLIRALPYKKKAFAMHTLRPPEGVANVPGVGGILVAAVHLGPSGFSGLLFIGLYSYPRSHSRLSGSFKRNQVSVRRSVGLSVRESVRFLLRPRFARGYEGQVAHSLHLTVFLVALPDVRRDVNT